MNPRGEKGAQRRAVMFNGIVDDYLYLATRALDEPASTQWRHSAESAYRRLGARAWEERLARVPGSRGDPRPKIVHLHPNELGGWTVGLQGSTFDLPDLKGLRHLRLLIERPGVK